MGRMTSPFPHGDPISAVVGWEALAERVFTAYANEDFAAALSAAEEGARRFPERDVHTTYWRACLHARLGDPDAAVRVLREAVERGRWWSSEMLRGDQDLGALQGRRRARHPRRPHQDQDTREHQPTHHRATSPGH